MSQPMGIPVFFDYQQLYRYVIKNEDLHLTNPQIFKIANADYDPCKHQIPIVNDLYHYVIRIEDLYLESPPIIRIFVDDYDLYKHILVSNDDLYQIPMRNMINDTWLMVYNDRYAS